MTNNSFLSAKQAWIEFWMLSDLWHHSLSFKTREFCFLFDTNCKIWKAQFSVFCYCFLSKWGKIWWMYLFLPDDFFCWNYIFDCSCILKRVWIFRVVDHRICLLNIKGCEDHDQNILKWISAAFRQQGIHLANNT